MRTDNLCLDLGLTFWRSGALQESLEDCPIGDLTLGEVERKLVAGERPQTTSEGGIKALSPLR